MSGVIRSRWAELAAAAANDGQMAARLHSPAPRFELLKCRDAHAVASTAAAQWVTDLAGRMNTDSPCAVALSGGRLTEAFFAEIVKQTQARAVSLAGVHFFWADERCVPPAHADSNFKLAEGALLSPLRIATDHIHRLKGEIDPATAARQAEADLRALGLEARDGQPVLDTVFLGMGEDGHVASLFPQELESMMADAAVYRAVFDSPKPPARRLTLGYRAIAAAREVWVLVSGGGKEPALRESLKPGGRTPLGRVIAMRPQTRIFTDIRL